MDAGAAMCHLHCRRLDGSLTADISYMEECFEAILEKTDVVVQASTGGISDLTIEERCRPLNYEKVESASLNGGSTNLGEAIYCNSFDDIRYCASEVYKRGILPETEVFDIGMIHNMKLVEKSSHLQIRNCSILYSAIREACRQLRRCCPHSVLLFRMMRCGE